MMLNIIKSYEQKRNKDYSVALVDEVPPSIYQQTEHGCRLSLQRWLKYLRLGLFG